MVTKVEQFIRQHQMPPTGSKIIVGLSGGADSVVLLHILNRLGYDCIAAHCNFQLRGAESIRDKVFSEQFAAAICVPFETIEFDTTAYATRQGISIEMAARELRYEWFDAVKNKTDATAIAVAHHREDSVETLLINLIRGTGIHGLTGIKAKTKSLMRPLLCVTKEDIFQYARQEQLSFVTDSSNLQATFDRNKIRLELIPLLQTLNPSVLEALERTASNLQQTAIIYDDAISLAKNKCFDKEKLAISIPDILLFPSPQAVLYEILSEYGFKRVVIQEIADALSKNSGKQFFSQTYRLLKDRNYLLLELLNKEKGEISIHPIYEKDLFITDPVPLKIDYVPNNESFALCKNKEIAYLDADKLIYPLLLRKWKAGDSFIPFGMTGKQKLSDYFNNHKFSTLKKENTWLLCSDDKIIWIVGERIDNRFRITKQTKRICIIHQH